MSEGVTERRTFTLVGGPYDGLLVSRALPGETVVLNIEPGPGYPVPAVYANEGGEFVYVCD